MVKGILLLMALLGGCLGGGSVGEEAPLTGEPRQVILKIDGMTCPGCPGTIEAALLQLEGVVKAEVSQDEGRGMVVYDGSRITASEIASAKIFTWGVYTAEVLRDEPLGGR
jgi:copper chaperone CopZ